MHDKEIPWYMRLTMVNNRTGGIAFAMYPCDKFEMLESLDLCELPYGSGEYSHLAKSANGVEADSLQVALSGIIESSGHPPSIHELNYLGTQIQRMSKIERSHLEQEIVGLPGAIITDAINAAHRLLLIDLVYDGESLSDRAVLWEKGDSYLRVQFVLDDEKEYGLEEEGVWVNCPAEKEELKAVAEKLGGTSYHDLLVKDIYAVVDKIADDMIHEFLSFDDFNHWAHAMKDNDVIRELSKYKAILEFEGCMDIREATVLAGKLDDYEFYQGETLSEVGNRYRNDNPMEDDEEDMETLADFLGFEDTHYGIVRKADEATLEQHGQELI
jgi:hypothetical protein